MFVVSEHHIQTDRINGLFTILRGRHAPQMFRIKDKSDGHKFQSFYKLDKGIIYLETIAEG